MIHLARSGGGNLILGQASLAACISLSRKELEKNKRKHCISDSSEVTYPKMHVWVLKGARRYKKPLRYKHARGAIVWVKIHKWFNDP